MHHIGIKAEGVAIAGIPVDLPESHRRMNISRHQHVHLLRNESDGSGALRRRGRTGGRHHGSAGGI